jgi:hypothetical protein
MFPSAWTYYDILYLGAVLVGFLGFGGTLFYESQRWERHASLPRGRNYTDTSPD